MRKHLWIYTLTYIINSSVFMNNIYRVTVKEQVLFPTKLPKVTCFSHITAGCLVWL